jgi:hypothetical protein
MIVRCTPSIKKRKPRSPEGNLKDARSERSSECTRSAGREELTVERSGACSSGRGREGTSRAPIRSRYSPNAERWLAMMSYSLLASSRVTWCRSGGKETMTGLG